MRGIWENVTTDILWSDPNPDVETYEKNPRGCRRLFGVDAVLDFTEATGVCTRVIRAHESCARGFDFSSRDPVVLPLFSCSDCCEMMNDVAFAIVKDEEIWKSPVCRRVRQYRKRKGGLRILSGFSVTGLR
jgi:serine/threonine-protein phosphatase PP1 catalytic subunit